MIQLKSHSGKTNVIKFILPLQKTPTQSLKQQDITMVLDVKTGKIVGEYGLDF